MVTVVAVVGAVGAAGFLARERGSSSATTTRFTTSTIVSTSSPTTLGSPNTLQVVGETRALRVVGPAGWDGFVDDSEQLVEAIGVGPTPSYVIDFGVWDEAVGATFRLFSSSVVDDDVVFGIAQETEPRFGCDGFAPP